MNSMKPEQSQTETSAPVGSTPLLAIIRRNREVVAEAIGKELERLHKESERLKSEATILWHVRAELLRDKDMPNDS